MRRQQKHNTLTERDRLIWQFIALYQGAHGFPPTQREIAADLSMTVGMGISRSLERLARCGVIALTSRQPRGIQLLRKPRYCVVLNSAGEARPVAVNQPRKFALDALDQALTGFVGDDHIFFQDGDRFTVRQHDASFVAELVILPA